MPFGGTVPWKTRVLSAQGSVHTNSLHSDPKGSMEGKGARDPVRGVLSTPYPKGFAHVNMARMQGLSPDPSPSWGEDPSPLLEAEQRATARLKAIECCGGGRKVEPPLFALETGGQPRVTWTTTKCRFEKE